MASAECAASSVCVAGRCQSDKVNVKPAVESARRLVLRPVDLGYVKRGDAAFRAALPSVFTLGHDGGKLFLRFAADLPPSANVVEAYVVLHRASIVDDDPLPVSLHATRIVESWSGGSLSWAVQPRSMEVRAPSTTIEPSGGPLVRLDVRDVVRQWARRDPADHGIAIVADHDTRTGMTFAIHATGVDRTSTEYGDVVRRGATSSASNAAPDVEPYLELYVR